MAIEEVVHARVRPVGALEAHLATELGSRGFVARGGDPSAAGEVVRADHATAVVVVALVPAVVRELVATMRIGEDPQQAAGTDRFVDRPLEPAGLLR